MSDEGFLTSNSFDTTWIKPFGQEWKSSFTLRLMDSRSSRAASSSAPLAPAQAGKQFVVGNPGIKAPGVQPFGSGIIGTQYRWKNNILPYEIDATLPNRQRVLDDRALEEHTPIRIHCNEIRQIGPSGLCPVPSRQQVRLVGWPARQAQGTSLPRGDCSAGNCIHEIGHTVGLWHEQSRRDRDSFITINWASIVERQAQFRSACSGRHRPRSLRL